MFRGKQLARRTLLRGLGTTLALPLLDAMFPAFATAAKVKAISPCRMAFLYVPNGIVMDQWTPTKESGTVPLPRELPRISQALAPFREDVMMLTFPTMGDIPGLTLPTAGGKRGRAQRTQRHRGHGEKTHDSC